jgi:hypothetical protein
MSEPMFEQLRIPAALVLIITVAFIFLPRSGEEEPAAATATPAARSSPTAGEPGGAITATVTPTAAADAEPDAGSDRDAVPDARPRHLPGRGPGVPRDCWIDVYWPARVLPARAGALTALVRFSDANAGDTISVALGGPGGTIDGGPTRCRAAATATTTRRSRSAACRTATTPSSPPATAPRSRRTSFQRGR